MVEKQGCFDPFLVEIAGCFALFLVEIAGCFALYLVEIAGCFNYNGILNIRISGISGTVLWKFDSLLYNGFMRKSRVTWKGCDVLPKKAGRRVVRREYVFQDRVKSNFQSTVPRFFIRWIYLIGVGILVIIILHFIIFYSILNLI
jgi:hypothetical protein